VAGVLDVAVERIRKELLPKYPNVDGVVGLEHTYGCGVAIDAPDAVIPIRTLRHISQNPNFGGEVMVLSLGCEKLQPSAFCPWDDRHRRCGAPAGRTACRLHVDDRFDHGHRRAASRTAECAAARDGAASELVVGVQCGGSDAFSAPPPTRLSAIAPTCWCVPARR